jgi:hypothetical protein
VRSKQFFASAQSQVASRALALKREHVRFIQNFSRTKSSNNGLSTVATDNHKAGLRLRVIRALQLHPFTSIRIKCEASPIVVLVVFIVLVVFVLSFVNFLVFTVSIVIKDITNVVVRVVLVFLLFLLLARGLDLDLEFLFFVILVVFLARFFIAQFGLFVCFVCFVVLVCDVLIESFWFLVLELLVVVFRALVVVGVSILLQALEYKLF